MHGTKLKLLIALPDGRIHKLKIFGNYYTSFREAPMTGIILASLVPDELHAGITVADESIQKLPLNERFDIVAISVLTGTSTRAYEIARHYRKMGAFVVLGGVHVTLCPDEAQEHADSIVCGYGEEMWPQLLNDYLKGRTQARYVGGPASLQNYPTYNSNFLKRKAYLNPDVIFATRGCKGTCDFCSVPAAGFKWDTRPVGEVIEQVKSFKGSRLAFNDVSLLEDREYSMELFTELASLKKKWGGLCTSRVADDDEMLDLMAKSGCIFLLVGIESINPGSLSSMNKGFNKPDQYKKLVQKLHERDIVLMGCFIFGTDEDNLSVFKDTVEMVDELRIDIPRYAIYTPYPGTDAFKKLESEGRLLHKRWEHYDTQHVVFQPKNMSPVQLDEGFRWAYIKSYTIKSMLKRTTALMSRFPFSFMGNLAYRIYLKRLQNEKERIYYTNS